MASSPSAALLLTILILALSAVSAEHTNKSKKPSAAAVEREILNIRKFLNTTGNSGYSALHRMLRQTNLPQKHREALAGRGAKITIFAPNNKVVQKFVSTHNLSSACQPTTPYILMIHILPFFKTRKDMLAMPVGAKVETVSPVPLTKIDRKLTIGVTDGFGNVLSSARVTKPEAYKSDYIIVHGIDSMLMYPAGTPSC